MNNRTALKLSKYNLAPDSETVYINDMTYISNPRPEEYSCQFQETAASISNQWMSLKDAIEQCEAMSLVNIKAKVLDVRETQLVSQKRLQMAESIISDGTTTAPLILWEKDIAPVQKGKAFNFEQVAGVDTEDIHNLYTITAYDTKAKVMIQGNCREDWIMQEFPKFWSVISDVVSPHGISLREAYHRHMGKTVDFQDDELLFSDCEEDVLPGDFPVSSNSDD
ncbi:hypothetical protein ACROYT_G016117 [Oculina patagonica]